jgi:quercetin dioxygenase-like cupin family protein
MMPVSPVFDRTFNIEKFLQFSDVKAAVTEIVATPHSRIAVWGVRPGQEVPAHSHPGGQDTWIMLRGELTYYLGNGARRIIRAGDLDIAGVGDVHGAINEGAEDAVFLSIYNAPEIGWERAVP